MMNKNALCINKLSADYGEYSNRFFISQGIDGEKRKSLKGERQSSSDNLTGVLRDVSLTVEEGQIVCIVGESGSGKTTLIRAITGWEGLNIREGKIYVRENEISHLSFRDRRKLLGRTVGYIPQNPVGSFNPIRKYEPQIREMLASHGIGYDRSHVEEAFARMGLESPGSLLRSRPYELSGGMNQRAAIAAVMLLEPTILLCDEPTSALDVMTANVVKDEFIRLNKERGTTVLMVTHNLGLANIIADSIAIMSDGRIVESGKTMEVMRNPKDDYTKKLIGDVLRIS